MYLLSFHIYNDQRYNKQKQSTYTATGSNVAWNDNWKEEKPYQMNPKL